MFDPKAFSLAQIRAEEMRRNVDFERSIDWYSGQPPFHKRMLAGVGRRMIAWGAALENRYGEVKQHSAVAQQANWQCNGNRMERAL
jgi:hypothetical protein